MRRVAETFGLARVSYGLFLPYLRDEFGLSTSVLGVIASGLHAGNLCALAAVVVLAGRTGARVPVLVACCPPRPGLALVAAADDVRMPAAGVILAGTGAGWTWSPYNDIVEAGWRPARATGSWPPSAPGGPGGSVGMLAAGVLALGFGTAWLAASAVHRRPSWPPCPTHASSRDPLARRVRVPGMVWV